LEGEAPVLGEWQTYTYSLKDLSEAGLDISEIDILMFFPYWGMGEGAVYRVDNVKIYDPNAKSNISTISIQYGTDYYQEDSPFVSKITIDGTGYDLTIADGKLFYNDGAQDWVVEMLENTGLEFVVCIYEAGQSCVEGVQKTWYFEQPAT
jgi:hypothetical protein